MWKPPLLVLDCPNPTQPWTKDFLVSDLIEQITHSVRYGAGRGGFSLTRPRPSTGPGGVYVG